MGENGGSRKWNGTKAEEERAWRGTRGQGGKTSKKGRFEERAREGERKGEKREREVCVRERESKASFSHEVAANKKGVGGQGIVQATFVHMFMILNGLQPLR